MVTIVYWRSSGSYVFLVAMDLTPFSHHCGVGSALTILVVEDDARIRLQIADHLARRGYLVVEADSADNALELLERDSGAIDCVFSDVQMPGRHDGVALARWILRHRPGLAVLLTSGNFRTEDLEPELRTVLPVLAKPYRGEAVEERLISLASTRRSSGRP
jgi:CheY-like chemotaxis protein